MKSVFDTPFEMSIRLTLLLLSSGTAKTADMLALTDTIAIYGGEFGIAAKNLHGGIDYVLDEYDTRRELIKTALKDLTLRELVNVSEYDDGFRYSLSGKGAEFTDRLESDYAVEYLELARTANKLTAAMSEREVFARISKVCEDTFNRRRANG
ncbi:MAG: hypothetical protein LBN97_04370 [Oscillospiraceae bacterium]|jgi:hypothetical protein|nr:hypothetical protein [Oscillospiraceae bacterium]